MSTGGDGAGKAEREKSHSGREDGRDSREIRVKFHIFWPTCPPENE